MILHRYFAIRFLKTFAGVFGIFFLIMVFIDLVEQLGRFSNTDAALTDIIGPNDAQCPAGHLRDPAVDHDYHNRDTIFGAIAIIRNGRDTRRWPIRCKSPAIPLVDGISDWGTGRRNFNPIVAATSREFEERSNGFKGRDRVLTLGSTGLWLRQGDDASQTVIRAETANLDGTVLQNVTFLTFAETGLPLERVAARSAILTGGSWVLSQPRFGPLPMCAPQRPKHP